MIAAVASTAVGVAGSLMSGQAAAAQGRAQKLAADRQATVETMSGEYQAQRRQDEINQTMGQQVALTAGSGVQLEGSPLDVIGSTASDGALDAGAIRWGAKKKADDLQFQGQMAQIQGNNARRGSILSAAGDIFGGLGRVGGMLDPNRLDNLSGRWRRT